MKKYFYYMMLLMGLMLGVTSCGDDEKQSELPPGQENPIQNGKWVEKGNTLTYTSKFSAYGVSYDMEWTMTFADDDTCLTSKCVYKFRSSNLADEFYDEMKNDGYSVAKSEKNVTVDFTEEHKGMQKSLLKTVVEAMSGQGQQN